jgi:hypothetical protein
MLSAVPVVPWRMALALSLFVLVQAEALFVLTLHKHLT